VEAQGLCLRKRPYEVTSSRGSLPRQFWALFVSRLVTRMGSFVVPFLTLYLTRVRLAPLSLVGVVLVAFGLGALLAPVIGGVLTDRFGRKIVLIGSLFGAGLLLIPVYFAHSIIWLSIAVLFYGFVLGLGRPAQTAMVADLIGPEQRRRAYALLFWATNLGFAVAMAAAGVLSTHGFSYLFLGDGLSCALGGVVVLLGTQETHGRSVRSRRPAGRLTIVLRDGQVVVLVVLGVAYASLYQQVSITLPLAMVHAGLSSASYGVDIALNGVLIVALQPLGARWIQKMSRMPLLAASTAVVGVGLASSILAHSTVGYAFSIAVWTVGEVGTAGVLSSVITDLAPPALRGRYAGVQGSSWGVARLVAPAIGLAVFNAFGPTWLFVGCGVDGLLVALGYLFMTGPLRRRMELKEVA